MALAAQPASEGITTGHEGGVSAPTNATFAGDGPIQIPDASQLFNAEFVRSGNDLTLVGDDGNELLIVNYFSAGAPDLMAPNHAMLDGQTVTLLAGPQFPGQYAQAGGAAQTAEAIGKVEILTGNVTVQHADGTSQPLKPGDPVFESDVVSTGPGASIGMKLADGTLLSLQESGKLAINEFVYSDGGADNSALVNVIQGTFSLFAGQVAPTGDMKIQTPIATMGIRGTSILGVDVDAVLGRLALTQDPGGHVGFIEIFNNANGNLFTVLRTVFEKITVSESGLLSLTPKTPEELSIDQTLTELLHNFHSQVPQQGPDETPRPQSGPNRFETPNIQEITFDPGQTDQAPGEGGELLLPEQLLEQFIEFLLQIPEIRDEIVLTLQEAPSAGEVVLDDQLEGEDGEVGSPEGGEPVDTTLPFDFGTSGPGSVGFASLDGQPVRSPGPDGNPVTADGQPVESGGVQLVYSWDAGSNTLFAMAGEEVIFTIEVNPTTGEVNITIKGAVDHLGLNDELLSIDIPFTVQAANGQTATGALTISITDDVPVIGDLPGINEAGPDGALEADDDLLNQTTVDALNTLPGDPDDLSEVLATVQGEVGSLTKAIAVVWDFLDDAYVGAGPNQPNINEAFVRLGVEYAEYLQNGGVPLTDVTAKFTPDNDNSGDPDRLQSLHDNLLGNLWQSALEGRFSEPLLTELKNLIESVDPDLLDRPYYAGNEGEDRSATREWDIDNGFGPEGVVDEDDLPGGTDGNDPVSITRDLAVDWGADDADNDVLGGGVGDRTLTFDASLNGVEPAGLTSNGEQITYTLSDDGTVLTASTSAGTVFTVQLDDDGTGSYTFTLEGKLDHSGVGKDHLFLDFGIIATDSDSDSANGNFTVAVTDDVPVAEGDIAEVCGPLGPTSNIVILMDTSNSMNTSVGNQTRLDLAKSAALNLLAAVGIGHALIVDFADDANASGWKSPEEASNYVATNLQNVAGGDTNLDGALLKAGVYFPFAPNADHTYVYVLSDGGASEINFTLFGVDFYLGDQVGPIEEQAWKEWLAVNSVDGAFGYSLGDNGASQLDPVGWVPGGNDNVADLTDPNQLIEHFYDLIGYTPPTADGNVLDNDFPGADGFGDISSIVIDGVTYEFNAETGPGIMLSDGGQNGQQPSAEFGDVWASVTTLQGGIFKFYFADDAETGHEAGDWQYVASGLGENTLPYEHIRYTVTDGDGDQITSDLVIEIEPDAIQGVAIGGEGDDTLTGVAGDTEVLVGGLGADKFVLNSFEVSDFIADYNQDEGDVIDLSALLDGYNQANQTSLSGEEFLNEYVSYNSESGEVSVDSSVVATLGNSPADVTIVVDDTPQAPAV